MAPARLIYYPDSNPGISRQRHGRGFSYVAPDGTRIDDPTERARLAALAIPPAYEAVWIAPMANAHLQATGRDTRKRKQYRYHPDWSAARAQNKYDQLKSVGAHLPQLRRWIATHLRGPTGAQRTAIAAVLALIDRAAMRPGDPGYTEENGTYGALTLEARHLTCDGDRVTLRYAAKGGKPVQKELHGARLARVLHRSADLPGPRLFDVQADDGTLSPLRSDHVQEVLRETCGTDVTPKSLRTWAGTCAAFSIARERGAKVRVGDMADAAAARLHNTPTIARNSYIHPEVIALADDAAAAETAAGLSDDGPDGLRRSEAALLRFLDR
ncbi:MAG: DNA topoisomerase IB [Tateyamaria sp.]